jgi:hypothetical protein
VQEVAGTGSASSALMSWEAEPEAENPLNRPVSHRQACPLHWIRGLGCRAGLY